MGAHELGAVEARLGARAALHDACAGQLLQPDEGHQLREPGPARLRHEPMRERGIGLELRLQETEHDLLGPRHGDGIGDRLEGAHPREDLELREDRVATVVEEAGELVPHAVDDGLPRLGDVLALGGAHAETTCSVRLSLPRRTTRTRRPTTPSVSWCVMRRI